MKHNVFLSELAHKKIMYWVHKADNEVSGFGMVKYLPKEKCFYITDAFLIEQTVTGGSTDIDPKGYGKLLYETARLDGECLFWWHSHVKMGVFWSGTDMTTIKDLGKNGWIVASVFNQKGEVRSATAYMAKVVSPLDGSTDEQLVVHDELQTVFETPPIDEKFKKFLDSEFDKKVKKYVPPVTTTRYTQGAGGQGGRKDFLERHGKLTTVEEIANASAKAEEDSDLSVETVAVRNIMSQKGELEGEDLFNQLMYGLRGYGSEIEAEALDLTIKTYENILRQNNNRVLANLEDRLILLESDGTIDKILERKMKEYDQQQMMLPTERLRNGTEDKH